jgi:hypothetical protein
MKKWRAWWLDSASVPLFFTVAWGVFVMAVALWP